MKGLKFLLMLIGILFVFQLDGQTFSLSGTVTEGSESSTLITVTIIPGNRTFDASLSSGNWRITSPSSGVSITNLSRVSNTQVTFNFGSTLGDYDSDQTITMQVDKNEFEPNLLADTSINVTFHHLIESISLASDNVSEGNEDTKNMVVTLANDNFKASLNKANWSLVNAPPGITIASVTRDANQQASITLNTGTIDYDVNKTAGVSVNSAEFARNNSTLTSGNAFTFNAAVEAEFISLSGTVNEGSENGSIVTVTLSGATFQNPLNAADFTLLNQPTGVSLGSVNRVSSTLADLTLSGDARWDYDNNITNLTVTLKTSGFDDNTSNSDLSANSGFTFIAASNPESIALSNNGITVNEGSEGGKYVKVTLTNADFRDPVATSDFTVTNMPQGISIASVSRKSDSEVWLYFGGTLTRDYDADITNLSVTLKPSGYYDSSDGASISATTGFTFTAVDDNETASLSGSVTEGSENLGYVSVTLSNGTYKAGIGVSDFTVGNLPQGITIGSVTYYSSTEARLNFSGKRTRDYDANRTNLSVVVKTTAYDDASLGSDITATGTFTFNAVNDAEDINLYGSANEGSEAGDYVIVKIVNGTFSSGLSLSDFTFSNFPPGVSEDYATRVDDTTAWVYLTGNRTLDYDQNITNLSVILLPSGYDDSGTGGGNRTANSGFTFIASDIPESIAISGTAGEAAEAGSIITLTLSNGQFKASPGIGDFSLTNQPAGVSIGSVNRLSDTQVELVLSGIRTQDYDANITNLRVTLKASGYDDADGVDVLSPASGFVFTATDDPEVISITGTANEENEHLGVISVSLAGGTFKSSFTGSWTAINLPQGVTLGTPVRTGPTTATIALSGDRTRDYDVSVTNLILNVPQVDVSDAAGTAPQLSANTGFTFNATDDQEIISISGTANEGSEHLSSIAVSITGGTFKTTLSGWTVLNLPQGVSMGTITRTNPTLASIALLGDRTRDYDVDLTNLSVTVPLTDIDDASGTAPILTDADGFTFQANDDQEVVQLSGTAAEKAENGVLVQVSITGGTFANPLTGGWALSNLPQGISQGAVARTGNTTATIALTGNSTKDYDVNITNLSLTVPSSSVDDPLGSLPSQLTVNSGFTFNATYENPSFGSSSPAGMPEGLQTGRYFALSLQEDTFNIAGLDTNLITLTGQPLGVSIASLTPVGKNQVNVFLQGNSVEDFDQDKTGTLTIKPGALMQHSAGTYTQSCTFPATSDAESISLAWTNALVMGQEASLNKDTLLVSITGGTFNPATLAANVSISGTALNYGVSKKSVSAITRSSFKLALAWDSTDFDSNLNLRVAVAPAGYLDPYPGNPILTGQIPLTALNDPELLQVSYSASRGTYGMEKRLKGEIIHVGITGGSFKHSPDKVTGHVTLSGTAVTDAHISLGSIKNVSRTGFDLVLNWDGTDFDDNDKVLKLSLDTLAYKDGVAALEFDNFKIPFTREKVVLPVVSFVENEFKTGSANIQLKLFGATWKAADFSNGHYKASTINPLLNNFVLRAGAQDQLDKLIAAMTSNVSGGTASDSNKTVVRMNDTLLVIHPPAVFNYEINENSRYGIVVPAGLVDSTSGPFDQPVDLQIIESPSTTATLFGETSICADGSTAKMTLVLTGMPNFTVVINRDGAFYASYSGIASNVFDFYVSAAGVYTIASIQDQAFLVTAPNIKITGSVNLIVHPLPTGLAFVGLNSTYAVNTLNSVELNATPSGGAFSGSYVGKIDAKYYFYPLQSGDFRIIYTYTDPNNCSNTDTASVKVIPGNAVLSYSPNRTTFCKYESAVIISATKASDDPGWYRLTRNNEALTVLGKDTVRLNPSQVSGNDTITLYYYFTIGKDTAFARQLLKIEAVEALSINPVDAKICQKDPLKEEIVLTGNGRPGSIFSGNGVLGNPLSGFNFYPNTVSAGTHTLTYRQTSTSAAACVTEISTDVEVIAVPTLGFSVQDSCITGSDTDSTHFINTTSGIDRVASWSWNFGDGNASISENNSGLKDPAHRYKWDVKSTDAAGTKTVQLTATSKPEFNSCVANYSKTIKIGMVPVNASFAWDNECFVENQKITFAVNPGSGSESEGADNSFSWKVYQPGTSSVLSTHTGKKPEIIFDNLSSHRIDLIYTTNFGCSFTRSDTINLRPTIQLVDEYYEDFENGNNGWFSGVVQDTATINSWRLGNPDNTGLTHAASGDMAWYTKIISRKQKEQSYISGPCFDFSKMKNPMVTMDIWRSFSNQQDGAMLQYSTDPQGKIWNTIGTTNEAVNWYTEFQILGFPDNKTIGWSAGLADAGWLTARHWINELAGKPNVRLRILYGSNGSSLALNEGFAFDNIWIGEKKRRVVLEHFTSGSKSADLAANELINKLIARSPAASIDLQYHLNLNGDDPLYTANPDDANGRLFYYGILQAPYSYIDGGAGGAFNFVGTNKPTAADVDNRSLVDPPFELRFTYTLNGQDLAIEGVLKAAENLPKEIVSVQTAVVEPQVTGVSGAGNVLFENVVRKLLPSAAGTNFKRSWAKGDSAVFTLNWKLQAVTKPSDITLVMFAQNYSTREVYQVATSDTTSLPTGLELPLLAGSADFRIFPNPAREKIVIALDEPAQEGYSLSLLDLTGRTVLMRKIEPGERYIELEVSSLPRGLYLVRSLLAGAPVKRLILTE